MMLSYTLQKRKSEKTLLLPTGFSKKAYLHFAYASDYEQVH